MRKILFRGKPKSNNEYYCFSQIWRDFCKNGFVYGSLIVKEDKYFICVSTAGVKMNCCINNSTVSMIEVIPETVGQYTGLTDKNGTKIFEGDIVKENIGIGTVKFGDYETPYRNVSVITQDIYSKHIGFYIEWINVDFRKDIGYWLNKIDVIGNIHDNPELLKEANLYGKN